MHPDQDVDTPPGSSRGLILVLALVAGVLLFISLVRQRGVPSGKDHPAVGRTLADIHVKPLLNADRAIRPEDLRGKVTLINFWGPWCGPCLRELPELAALEQKYRGRTDVRVLLVAFPRSAGEATDELREETREVLKNVEGDPAVYYDPDHQLPRKISKAAALDGFGFPTTLLLDQSGAIRAVWTGYRPQYVQEMGPAIEDALDKG
jgi:thiol-disulfide isomerase/thioredoxin